jgi:hypothetical protein
MNPRGDQGPQAPQLKALYSVAALARIGNVDRRLLLRVLRSNDVTLVRQGRANYVSSAEIRRKIPTLWRSLRLAAQLRGMAGELARARLPAARMRQPRAL